MLVCRSAGHLTPFLDQPSSGCVGQSAAGRREGNKARTREKILDIAEKCFLKDGYERTSMSCVAKALGGSKGTLWTYFRSKEDLVEAVVDRLEKTIVSEIEGLSVAVECSMRLMHADFAKAIKVVSSDRYALMYRIAAGESPRGRGQVSALYERAIENAHSALADFVANQILVHLRIEKMPKDIDAYVVSVLHGSSFHKRLLGVASRVTEDEIRRDAEYSVKLLVRLYARQV